MKEEAGAAWVIGPDTSSLAEGSRCLGAVRGSARCLLLCVSLASLGTGLSTGAHTQEVLHEYGLVLSYIKDLALF